MPCAGAHAGQHDAACQSSRNGICHLDAEFLHLNGDKLTNTPAISARCPAPKGAGRWLGSLGDGHAHASACTWETIFWKFAMPCASMRFRSASCVSARSMITGMLRV